MRSAFFINQIFKSILTSYNEESSGNISGAFYFTACLRISQTGIPLSIYNYLKPVKGNPIPLRIKLTQGIKAFFGFIVYF